MRTIYKTKVLRKLGWVGRSLPKPNKLDVNVPIPNRGGPYNLISMRKSVHNGIQLSHGSNLEGGPILTCKSKIGPHPLTSSWYTINVLNTFICLVVSINIIKLFILIVITLFKSYSHGSATRELLSVWRNQQWLSAWSKWWWLCRSKYHTKLYLFRCRLQSAIRKCVLHPH